MVSFTLQFQLHPTKSLMVCYIASFYKLLKNILDKNNMAVKDN